MPSELGEADWMLQPDWMNSYRFPLHVRHANMALYEFFFFFFFFLLQIPSSCLTETLQGTIQLGLSFSLCGDLSTGVCCGLVWCPPLQQALMAELEAK